METSKAIKGARELVLRLEREIKVGENNRTMTERLGNRLRSILEELNDCLSLVEPDVLEESSPAPPQLAYDQGDPSGLSFQEEQIFLVLRQSDEMMDATAIAKQVHLSEDETKDALCHLRNRKLISAFVGPGVRYKIKTKDSG